MPSGALESAVKALPPPDRATAWDDKELRYGRHGTLQPTGARYSGIAFAWLFQARATNAYDLEKVAVDIEDVHAWTRATLYEAGWSLPTVVVVRLPQDSQVNRNSQVNRDDLMSRLFLGEDAAATWVIGPDDEAGASSGADDDPVELLVNDLLSPAVVPVELKLRTEDTFARELRAVRHGILQPFVDFILNWKQWTDHAVVDRDSFEEYQATTRRAFEDELNALLRRPVAGSSQEVKMAESVDDGPPPVRALKSISLTNFGGIEDATFSFGEHVTIIYAPNGAGKSSLSNGLVWALTGETWWSKNRATRVPGDSKPTARLFFGDDAGILHTWGESYKPNPLYPSNLLLEVVGIADQHVEQSIGRGDRPSILRTLRPKPPREEALQVVLVDRAPALLADYRQQLNEDQKLADDFVGRTIEVDRLRSALSGSVWGQLTDHRKDQLLGPLEALLEPRTPAGSLPKQIYEELSRLLGGNAKAKSGQRDSEQVRTELDAAQRALAALQTLGPWVGLGQGGMLSCLHALLRGLPTWSRTPTDAPPEAVPIALAFAMVERDALQGLVDQVQRLIGAAEVARSRVQELEAELAASRSAALLANLRKAHQEVRNWLEDNGAIWTEAVAALNRSQLAQTQGQERADALKHLAAVDEALSAFNRADQGDLTSLRDSLLAATNSVLRRYGTLGGALPGAVATDGPLVLENSDDQRLDYRVLTGGETRPLDTLSTGQKHQYALARMVAERQLIQTTGAGAWMGHRCLVLDDAASAHDDESLGREALILRQLAYHPDKAARVQLVLLTHHESLARRWTQLLAPPNGFHANRVTLQRSKRGPLVVDDSEITTTGPAPTDESMTNLASALNRTLRFGRPTP